jgi:polyhydroxyalkanoate synthase subunit PhaC
MSNLLECSDAKLNPYSAASEVTGAVETVANIARIWMIDPTKIAVAQSALVRSYLDLWNNSARRLFGEAVEPLVEPEPSEVACGS